jgi:hypothetical protein
MTARRTSILAGLLLASLFCRADSPGDNQLSVAEYRAQLNQLLVATEQLDSAGHPVPLVLKETPSSWRLHTDRQDFEISGEGLRRDVRKFEQEKTVTTASAVRSRIQSMIKDVDGFEAPPQDISGSRDRLASLLARPEFRDVRGPTFLDRLKQRIIAALVRVLESLFRSSAIPTISKFFVYGLIGLAVLTLAFIAYRQIRSAGEYESVVPTDLPVSVRNWAVWLAESRAAAARHDWSEAIRLAYWTGISFLELKGAWRPDRARTPREYLRMLSASSEYRETLTALTRRFELTWYAKQRADADAFRQMMQALEKLGCQTS